MNLCDSEWTRCFVYKACTSDKELYYSISCKDHYFGLVVLGAAVILGVFLWLSKKM